MIAGPLEKKTKKKRHKRVVVVTCNVIFFNFFYLCFFLYNKNSNAIQLYPQLFDCQGSLRRLQNDIYDINTDPVVGAPERGKMLERTVCDIDNIRGQWMWWIGVWRHLMMMMNRIGCVRCCRVFVLYAVDRGRGLLELACMPEHRLEERSVKERERWRRGGK
jgi:hypothetical protein